MWLSADQHRAALCRVGCRVWSFTSSEVWAQRADLNADAFSH